MFEGKHIHFSPTDNKPLCSYSGKLCRQRRLNGFAFCIRHILEDKSAPFKQCSYVTRNNSQKCLNAIPSNQDRGYCHSHMQVVGIIPKTERKSKTPSLANKTDSNSSFSSNGSLDKSTSSPINKKDPGAVFKFEEDSSDITDVFSYKNGLANLTLNGKNKGAKGKESNCNSQKYGKNAKSQNGFNSTNFTTKKVTDKNRNIYTAIIPTSNTAANNNSGSSKSRNHGIKNGSSNSSSNFSTTLTQQRSSSYSVNLESGFQTLNADNLLQNEGKELNILHNIEEIRQFENLKTLKKLDKSSIARISISSDEENSCDAKFKQFPRLAALSKQLFTSSLLLPNEPISSSNILKKESVTSSIAEGPSSLLQNSCKSEVLSSLPVVPPLARSNTVVVIKTEPQRNPVEAANDVNQFENGSRVDEEKITDDTCAEMTPSSSKPIIFLRSNSASCNASIGGNDICNSIESRDLNNRHEFLAHVRNTFKSQYTSIKEASKISERYEQDRKQKFRNSLIRCIKIDSSICAQVLVGNGSKPCFPSPIKFEVDCSTKDVTKKNLNYADYDDYDFYDSEGGLSISSVTKACTAVIDHSNTTRKYYSNGKKNGVDGKVKLEESANKTVEKRKATSKRTNSSGKKGSGPRSDLTTNPVGNIDTPQSITMKDSVTSTGKSVKPNGKKTNAQVAEETKPVVRSNPSKRRLKRSDAVLGTGGEDLKVNDSSLGELPPTNVTSPNAVVKRRRFLSGTASEIALTVNNRSSPSISSGFELDHQNSSSSTDVGLMIVKTEKGLDRGHHLTLNNPNPGINGSLIDVHRELRDILGHSSVVSTHRNQGLETVLNSVGSSETAGTPDGVITDASFDSTFEHSTSSQPDCEFSEEDLEHSFELQIDPEIENQASRLLEDNVLTEADFTELFPDNRMSEHKFGRNELQELGMAALDFDVNDIDYSLFANIFPNFPRTSQPESISISNPF